MGTSFGIVGGNGGGGVVVTDHNQLTGIGTYTHTDLDRIVDEINQARGSFISLDARIASIGNGGGGGGQNTSPSLSNYLYESFILDSDTDSIVITKGYYEVGTGELEVFVGGIKQNITKDYTESSPTSVVFTETIPAGSVVIFRVRDRYGSILPLNIHVENILVTNEIQQFTLNKKFVGYGLSLEVYLNGLLQTFNLDYFITEQTVNFEDPPMIGSLITFKVVDKNSTFLPKLLKERWVSNGLKTLYKLTEFTYEVGKNQLELYVNGVQYSKGIDYEEVDSGYIQLFQAAPENSEIVVYKENGLFQQTAPSNLVGTVELPTEKIDGIDFVYNVPKDVVTDIVTLNQEYNLGEKELVVFINGQATGHEEVNKTTIRLPIDIEEGDQVIVKRFPRFTGSAQYTLPEVLFTGLHYVYEVDTQPTDLVILGEEYNTGQQELIVFVNGQAVDYEEIDSVTIKLPFQVEVGDQVFVKRFPKFIVKLDKMISKTMKEITVNGNATTTFTVDIQTSAIDLKYLRITSSSNMNLSAKVIESSSDNHGVVLIETDSDKSVLYNGNVPYVNENGENKVLLKVVNRSSTPITFDVNFKYTLYAS